MVSAEPTEERCFSHNLGGEGDWSDDDDEEDWGASVVLCGWHTSMPMDGLLPNYSEFLSWPRFYLPACDTVEDAVLHINDSHRRRTHLLQEFYYFYSFAYEYKVHHIIYLGLNRTILCHIVGDIEDSSYD